MRYSKRVITALILSALIAGTFACGDATVKDPDSIPADVTTEAPKPVGYPYYEGADLGGKEFTVYNVKKDLWNMICVIQPDEINGETINDAIYNRNERVKQKLNCSIAEINAPEYTTMRSDVQTMILAGDTTYDAIYMPMFYLIDGLTENYYHCLNDVETIHLENDYWDQVLLEATSLKSKNYFATSSAHLMGWDGLWCLFFNESMMDDLQLEYPYQLVRDGKWTLNKLTEYSKAAANLNGDDSFALNADGNCVYGCLSFNNCVDKFLFGFGIDYVNKDKNDLPELACESEKFISTVQRFAELNNGDGAYYLNASATTTDATYYQNFYEKQRCLFLAGEIKTAQLLRGMEQSFGILPYPKLDEQQANYRSTAVHQCASFTIPVTNTVPQDVGLLFDALSYESDQSVVEPYFSVLVEQKGLRNEESIEMLNLIKDTRSFDIGIAYQWVVSISDNLKGAVTSANTDIASIIASNKPDAEKKLNDMLEAMK